MNTDREGLTQSEFNAKFAPWREIKRLTDRQIMEMSESSIEQLIDRISIEMKTLLRSHINEIRNKL